MLASFRAFAKSPLAVLLIGVLIVSFAVFEIRDVFSGRAGDAVITAGSRTITSADFKREFDNVLRRAEQETGQRLTPQIAADNGLDRQVLQGIATREAFGELMNRMGIRPSDKLVADQIAKIPAFFNQVSGRFEEKTYRQRLGENGLTPDGFEAMLRDQLAEQHMIGALANGLQMPRAYSAMAAIYALENRDVSYLTVEPGNVPAPPQPTDAQLTAFMNENKAQLTFPEFRVLSVVRFSPQAIAGTLPVDEAELRKRYDFRKDTLSKPETRTIVQIPAKDAATAQQIAARLSGGEAPAAVAKSAGVDAITYDAKPQSAIPDHKLAAAAFQAQPGQVSTVQGDLGLAVIKVVNVTPGQTVTFEQARPALEAELRKDAAGQKVYAMTQAYDEAHQKGANLAEAAQKAGVPPVTLPPISRDGRNQQGQPIPGLDPKLLETAFNLPSGGESEVTQAGQGEYFAVRVDRIIPPAMPPLAEIKPELTRAYMMREVTKAMQAKADALTARLKKGESLEAVAASAGAKITHVTGIDRQSGQQNPLVSPDILVAAFTLKPGEVFTARARTFGFAVGKVDAIRTGDAATLARMTEQTRPQMTNTIFRELGEGAETAARAKVKTKVDFNKARAAIGLSPVNETGKPAGLAK